MLNSKTQSKLFVKFMKGCEKRMGRLVKQDKGISMEMLFAMLDLFDSELVDESVSKLRKRFIILCAGTLFVILWVGTLRGGKVSIVEVSEFVTRRH